MPVAVRNAPRAGVLGAGRARMGVDGVGSDEGGGSRGADGARRDGVEPPAVLWPAAEEPSPQLGSDEDKTAAARRLRSCLLMRLRKDMGG